MEKIKKEKGGYCYFVSEEQMAIYKNLTTLQRLQWVNQARLFTLLGRTQETTIRQERLRQGKTIVSVQANHRRGAEPVGALSSGR